MKMFRLKMVIVQCHVSFRGCNSFKTISHFVPMMTSKSNAKSAAEMVQLRYHDHHYNNNNNNNNNNNKKKNIYIKSTMLTPIICKLQTKQENNNSLSQWTLR